MIGQKNEDAEVKTNGSCILVFSDVFCVSTSLRAYFSGVMILVEGKTINFYRR